MSAEREVGFDPLLERSQPDLLETHDLSLGEVLVGEIHQRRPAPQAESFLQACCSRPW